MASDLLASDLLAVELLSDRNKEAFLDAHMEATHAMLDESTQTYMDKIRK